MYRWEALPLWAWFGGLAQAVFNLGYPGILVALFIEGTGLPFPGDAMMALYGFAVAESKFAWHWVLVFCIAGYMLGALFSYSVSRWFAMSRQHKLARQQVARFTGFNPRSMMRTTRLIEKYGPVFLVAGRFLPGVRSVSSYVAGLTGMRLAPFLFYSLLGTILWCSTWIALGYWLEENVTSVLKSVQSSLAYVMIASAVAIFAWLAVRRWRRST